MEGKTALDILKNALLLERRGKAFYAKVAEQATAPAVKEFFGRMADEEDQHIEVLSAQYREYQLRGAFSPATAGAQPSDAPAQAVLSERLQREISAATFEAAAVSAAMAMERNAIRLYSERAQAATDPEEKALYQWLAEWEKEHLEFLTQVDRAVVETVWNDNHFWPL
jgi:rubrerythrin